MKIQTDRISGKPPYPLSEPEIRRVISALPSEWVADLSLIRMSNALELGDRTYFFRPEGVLTIYSRGRSREQVITDILTELAAYGLGF